MLPSTKLTVSPFSTWWTHDRCINKPPGVTTYSLRRSGGSDDRCGSFRSAFWAPATPTIPISTTRSAIVWLNHLLANMCPPFVFVQHEKDVCIAAKIHTLAVVSRCSSFSFFHRGISCSPNGCQSVSERLAGACCPSPHARPARERQPSCGLLASLRHNPEGAFLTGLWQNSV